ncbi:MAG: transcriptional regulator [Sphingomonas sp.]
MFAALADPTRRAVVERLGPRAGERRRARRDFPIALPSFLQHLKLLEASGLIRTESSAASATARSSRSRLSRSSAGSSPPPANGKSGSTALGAHLDQLEIPMSDAPRGP